MPCSSQQSLVAESSKSRAGVSLSYRRRRGDRVRWCGKCVWCMCVMWVEFGWGGKRGSLACVFRVEAKLVRLLHLENEPENVFRCVCVGLIVSLFLSYVCLSLSLSLCTVLNHSTACDLISSSREKEKKKNQKVFSALVRPVLALLLRVALRVVVIYKWSNK